MFLEVKIGAAVEKNRSVGVAGRIAVRFSIWIARSNARTSETVDGSFKREALMMNSSSSEPAFATMCSHSTTIWVRGVYCSGEAENACWRVSEEKRKDVYCVLEGANVVGQHCDDPREVVCGCLYVSNSRTEHRYFALDEAVRYVDAVGKRRVKLGIHVVSEIQKGNALCGEFRVLQTKHVVKDVANLVKSLFE